MYKLIRSRGQQKFQNGSAVPTQKNRNPITLTVVKGKDSKGTYTETVRKQSDDLYPGGPAYTPPAHQSNQWFNSLTPEQKKMHNEKVRAKEAALRAASITPPTPVPGQTAVDRVYDPVKPAPVKPAGKQWYQEKVVTPFGAHTTRGYSISGDELEAGLKKNAIDKTISYANRNTFEVVPTKTWEQRALDAGVLSDKDNPIGMSTADTIRRHKNVDIRMQKIADYNTKKQAIIDSRTKNQNKMVASFKKGGPMQDENKVVVVNGKKLHKKPVLVQKKKQAVESKDDCGCGDSEKMQAGGDLSRTIAAGSAVGTTYNMIKQKKDSAAAKKVSTSLDRDNTLKPTDSTKTRTGILFKCGGKSKMKPKK